jgi:hypothetical protein
LNKIILILTLFSLSAYSQKSSDYENYYEYYDNFNYENITALSAYTGNYLFGFLPVDIDNIDTKVKLIVSLSPFVKQAGDEYGWNAIENGESVDMLKNFSAVWNHKKEFMPFISYYTPYKSVLKFGEEREMVKKTDAITVGVISELKKHQVAMGLDMLMSSYYEDQNDNGGEYEFRRGGFSARILINMKVNKRSSMFFSASSPVYLDFDIDDRDEGKFHGEFFEKMNASAGFNYKFRDYYGVYSLVYRNYDKFYSNEDGKQVTYPWVIEHNFVFGYNFDKNLKVSVDYQLLPSVFTDNFNDSYGVEIGDTYRHTFGIFAGVNLGNFTLNARYADSKLMSEKSLARTYFQADLIYNIR